MFIPYRAKIQLTRIPWATIAASLLCLSVYWSQARNEERVVDRAKAFCIPPVAADIERAQKDYVHDQSPCWDVLAHTYTFPNPEAHLKWHVEKIQAAGDAAAAEALITHYRDFAASSPSYTTARLWQYSGSWNPLRMLTATISHGSWDHVIGNLFFFVSFAMIVETVIGPILFVLVFLAMALGIGALENLLVVDREGGVSLGLSGVVMGMMTLAAYFAPRIKIDYFYFFFFLIGVLSLPMWSVALWYVGWNLSDYFFYRDWSGIGYSAHLAGAVMGFLLGITVFRHRRHWVEEHLIADERDPHEDQSWLSKLNAIGNVPLVMGIGFFGFLIAVVFIVKFITTFAVQILLAAPAVAAVIQIYRMKRADRPDRVRYKEAVQLLEQLRDVEAFDKLKPLAEQGYPRAQYQLGRLFAAGRGTRKDERTAAHWFRQAAQRGERHAQYALAVCYADGRGVPADLDQALEWYAKAATALPEAAMALGYHNQHTRKNDPRSREHAANWYAKAVRQYLSAGAVEDAAAAFSELVSIEPDAVRTTELRALVESRAASQ